MNFDEAQVIAALAVIFGSVHQGVEVGIGDDGAVVSTTAKSVITSDMAVEGTHFNPSWSRAFDIGRKIAAANLADIYAMGATPQYLVVAVALVGDETMEWIEELAKGINYEAKSCGAKVVGGDLTRGPVKVISITALGKVEKAVLRSGARVGDSIYLSSLPGWSAAGLHLAKLEKEFVGDVEKHALSEFSAPTVDYSAARAFVAAGASSICDISDGLLIQARQVADASGTALHFAGEKFKAHGEFAQLAQLAKTFEIDIWQWIFAGGEDHVFLATGTNLDGFEVGVVEKGSGLIGLEMKKAPDIWRHFN